MVVMLNNKSSKKNKILLLASLILFVYSVVIFIICARSNEFANLYSSTVASSLRNVLSIITGWFSFSLFEIVLILLLPLVVCLIVLIAVKKVRFRSVIRNVIFTISVLSFIFVNSFGVCYFCSPIERRMGLERNSVSREELYNASMIITKDLEETLDHVSFAKDGSSELIHDWRTVSKLIDGGFDKISKEYDFISKTNALPKKIMLSKYMTYTHISGIFMPLTGEANVNTNYPDYVVTFSIAHEKAHQRGIASEDEANFVAFLALVNSGDEYLEYAGYMSMFEYFLDSMYVHDTQMYYYLIGNSDERVIGELYSYSVFFDEYRDSTASDVADNINDTYIKTMGDSEGVKSYGKVVELMCAYLNKE